MYGNFPSLFMGLVTPDGGLEHYDGLLRVVDSDGKVLEPGLSPERYREIIGEAVEPWSYLKFPYYKPWHCGANGDAPPRTFTRRACTGSARWRGSTSATSPARRGRPRAAPVPPAGPARQAGHQQLPLPLCPPDRDPVLPREDRRDGGRPRDHERTRARQAGVNSLVGVGVSEAPRGTLFHEYHVDEDGILQKVNLIIATGNNNLAMNRTVKQIAQSISTGTSSTKACSTASSTASGSTIPA